MIGLEMTNVKTCLKCGYARGDQDEGLSKLVCPRCGAAYSKMEAARKSDNESSSKGEVEDASVSRDRTAVNILRRPLPKYVGWVTRLIAYPFVVVVVFVLVVLYGNMQMVSSYSRCLVTDSGDESDGHTAIDDARKRYSCLSEHANWVGKLTLIPAGNVLEAAPNVPCRYVGVWDVVRGSSRYVMVLSVDARYEVRGMDDEEVLAKGSWSEYKGSLVWFNHDGLIWPLDRNKVIQSGVDDAFSLVERNGEISKFQLLRREGMAFCQSGREA